jgi:hypothetical protein
MTVNKKQYFLITGFFYPAILGAFIFETMKYVLKFFHEWVSGKPVAVDWLLSSLVIMLILQYVADYLYIIEDEPETSYSTIRMLSDIGIIVAMYFGIMVPLNINAVENPFLFVSLSLMITKYLSVIWEMHPKGRKIENIDPIALLTDELLFVLYSSLAVIYSLIESLSIIAILIVLFIDLLIWGFWKKINNFIEKIKLQQKSLKQSIDK